MALIELADVISGVLVEIQAANKGDADEANISVYGSVAAGHNHLRAIGCYS